MPVSCEWLLEGGFGFGLLCVPTGESFSEKDGGIFEVGGGGGGLLPWDELIANADLLGHHPSQGVHHDHTLKSCSEVCGGT